MPPVNLFYWSPMIIAPVAQGIEHGPPKAGFACVRIASGAPVLFKDFYESL